MIFLPAPSTTATKSAYSAANARRLAMRCSRDPSGRSCTAWWREFQSVMGTDELEEEEEENDPPAGGAAFFTVGSAASAEVSAYAY